MTTEAEAEAIAKTKWCPFARIASWRGLDDVPVNREANGALHPGAACLGSDCMAWQTYQGRAGITGYCGMMQRAEP